MCEIAKHYKLSAIDDIPKVKNVLDEPKFFQLADFDYEKQGERDKAYHVANLVYCLIIHKECYHQG